jgi:peroxiredoxin
VSVDAPELSRALRAELALPFHVLADAERRVIGAYGLVHEGGGLEGEAIAIPAQVLLRPDGSVAWSFVSARITDRSPPETVLRALERLDG